MLVRLEWLGYCTVKKNNDNVTGKPFSSNTGTGGTSRTDGRTEGQNCYISISRVSVPTRDKNERYINTLTVVGDWLMNACRRERSRKDGSFEDHHEVHRVGDEREWTAWGRTVTSFTCLAAVIMLECVCWSQKSLGYPTVIATTISTGSCLYNAMHRQNINVCVCVSVSVTLSVNSPTGQTPQRIFTLLID